MSSTIRGQDSLDSQAVMSRLAAVEQNANDAHSEIDDILSGSSLVPLRLPTVAQLSSNRNLGVSDINSVLVNASSSNYTVTIPAQAGVSWPTDAEIHLIRSGTGALTITGASGVTVNGALSGTVSIAQQYGSATLKRVSENVWVVVGALGLPPVFTKSYTSAELNIVAGSTASVDHGLGVMPKFVQAVFVCKTAEFGYVVGEEVDAHRDATSTAYNYTLARTSTSIRYICGSSGIALPNATGGYTTLTPANWKLVIRAWA